MQHFVKVSTFIQVAEDCVGCSNCVESCPSRGFTVRRGRAERKADHACTVCGICVEGCPANALYVPGHVEVNGVSAQS